MKNDRNMKEQKLKQEKQTWINLTNYYVWAILKACAVKERNIRSLMANGFSNPNALIKNVNMLVKLGLLEEIRRRGRRNIPARFVKTTPLGYELLGYYDKIGEIVKRIRKSQI
jgi:predicted transcriptional regulator